MLVLVGVLVLGNVISPVELERATTAAAVRVAMGAPEELPDAAAHQKALEDMMKDGQQASAGEGSAPAGRTQALRVAVYDFELSGIDPAIGQVVTDSTLAEVRKLLGVSAIGMDEIRDMLSHEANKQILGCEDNESCLAEIAGALGVDELVSGKLSKVDEGTTFILRRIDQRRAKVAGVVNKRLTAGSGEEFLAAIGPAVEELFPERQLKPGAERGVPKEVALRLNPPPLPMWATIGVGGAAVAAGAAAGFFGLLTMESQSSYDDFAAKGLKSTIDGSELKKLENRLEGNALKTNIFLGTAGVLAIGAGIMALFTDWYGYGAQASAGAGTQ